MNSVTMRILLSFSMFLCAPMMLIISYGSFTFTFDNFSLVKNMTTQYTMKTLEWLMDDCHKYSK